MKTKNKLTLNEELQETIEWVMHYADTGDIHSGKVVDDIKKLIQKRLLEGMPKQTKDFQNNHIGIAPEAFEAGFNSGIVECEQVVREVLK